MPMLFALGQHQALVQTQARMGNTEKVMAFLDDIVISTPEPDRVTEAHTTVAEELWTDARTTSPMWQNTSLEPWWHRACRDGGFHLGSQNGEARCHFLEGRSTPPATPTRIESVGCSNLSA